MPGGRTSILKSGLLPPPLHFTESFARLRFLSLRDKISIGRGSVVNRKVLLDGRGGLEIGREVGIAERSVILTGAHSFDVDGIGDHVWRTRLEDKVFINLGAMIMPGVIVGEGAVVAAGSIVTKDVEPWTIVAGVPAKKIGERPRAEYELYRGGVKGGYKADWR